MGAAADSDHLRSAWTDPEVIRRRFAPRVSDSEYLVLSDLQLFLSRFATKAKVRVLDFGAGPSPYREFFPNAEYRRADVIATEGLDYVIDADSKLPADIGEFDIVLSTQVAEHLSDPANYFREAWRVLKPGGLFIVTTHGTWEEHGAPFDFQRWTTIGLERDLRAAGWLAPELFKLTAGDRASLFLMFRWLLGITSKRSWFAQKTTGLARRLAALAQPMAHRWSDRRMAELRVIGPPHSDTAPLYMVLAATVRKR